MQPKLKKSLKKRKKYYYCKIQKMRSVPSRKRKNQGNYSKPKNKGNTEFSYLRENP